MKQQCGPKKPSSNEIPGNTNFLIRWDSVSSPAQVRVHTHKTNTDMHRERGKKTTKPSLARIVLIKKKKNRTSTRTIKNYPH